MNITINTNSGISLNVNDTGQLINAFYPLNLNPSSYITSGQTGNFITNSQTGIFSLTSNIQEFSTSIITGSNTQEISFPVNFSSIPRVLITVEISGSNMYLCNISQRTVSGYLVIFSDTIKDSGVIIHTNASIQ